MAWCLIRMTVLRSCSSCGAETYHASLLTKCSIIDLWKANWNPNDLVRRSAGEGPCHLPTAAGAILPYFLPDYVWRCRWSERYVDITVEFLNLQIIAVMFYHVSSYCVH